MRPYCTSLTREAVVEIAIESFDTLDLPDEISAHGDFVKDQIRRAFSDPRLPDVFKDKRHFSKCMFYHIKTPTIAVAEHCGLELTDVSSCRAKICTQIALTFYQSYIQEALRTLLIPYCQTHTPPSKHWGMCSIFYWDDAWGRAFYSFWKNNIEKNDDDIFCEQILPYLPGKWRSSYKPQKPACVCPHIWSQMDDDDMVASLCSLEGSRDPAKQQWGIGSLAHWKDPITKAPWGKSFWHYWRSYVEPDGEAMFRERMLPKFPLAWQENFKPMEVYNWQELSNIEIANMLETAHKPLGIKKWGLYSVDRWISKGRPLMPFIRYWRRSVEGAGEDAIFRRDILPLLSDTLQKTYRPVGYVMPLRESTDVDRTSVESIDDPDSLYELADKGNMVAFLKLKRILIIYVVSKLSRADDMQMDLLEYVIERAIHMHLPFFGKITTYATSSVKIFFSNLSPFVLTGDHPVPYHRFSDGLVENTVEGATVDELDAKNRIQHLKSELVRQGFPVDLISRLFDLLIDGVSLDEIILPDGSCEYEVDDELIHVAHALADIAKRLKLSELPSPSTND